jgi:hypothetical protein
MATNTYVALATQTLGSAAASVTFSSIPQGYTDLVVVVSGNGAVTTGITMQFNGVTSGYSLTQLGGNGSSASSARRTSQSFININYSGYFTTSGQSNIIVNIMNYSNTTTYKTVLCRANNAAVGTDAIVGLFPNTSAITSVLIGNDGSGNIGAGTTFSLYGIAATSVGAKATGGTIYSDDLYYYHVFDSTSTFTPLQSISADVLVVAGGGGGGSDTTSGNSAGGGGAGGLLAFASQALTATAYTVTVGAGGARAASSSVNGTNGVDSQFGALTLVKGGGGAASAATTNGSTGGSGGGAGNSGTGGSATSGQGFAGGNGSGTIIRSGGGGGAGAVGFAGGGTGSTFAQGGIGSSAYSSWGLATGTGENVSGTVYYAGGGGGADDGGQRGLGGSGGGGAGATTAGGGNNGTANTGGGGGGNGVDSASSFGGSGGSGIVIVRYLKA